MRCMQGLICLLLWVKLCSSIHMYCKKILFAHTVVFRSWKHSLVYPLLASSHWSQRITASTIRMQCFWSFFPENRYIHVHFERFQNLLVCFLQGAYFCPSGHPQFRVKCHANRAKKFTFPSSWDGKTGNRVPHPGDRKAPWSLLHFLITSGTGLGSQIIESRSHSAGKKRLQSPPWPSSWSWSTERPVWAGIIGTGALRLTNFWVNSTNFRTRHSQQLSRHLWFLSEDLWWPQLLRSCRRGRDSCLREELRAADSPEGHPGALHQMIHELPEGLHARSICRWPRKFSEEQPSNIAGRLLSKNSSGKGRRWRWSLKTARESDCRVLHVQFLPHQSSRRSLKVLRFLSNFCWHSVSRRGKKKSHGREKKLFWTSPMYMSDMILKHFPFRYFTRYHWFRDAGNEYFWRSKPCLYESANLQFTNCFAKKEIDWKHLNFF